MTGLNQRLECLARSAGSPDRSPKGTAADRRSSVATPWIER